MKLAFVFTGHGTQRWDMGRQLLKEEPLFRETIEECDKLARQHVEWSIMEELLADESDSRISSDHVEIAQTVFFAIQVALARLWRSWGIEPDSVLGYSMGEVAASHVAGIISLSDAIRVIITRSSLYCQALCDVDQCGEMAWVKLSQSEARRKLNGYKDKVWIAAHSSPVVTILSGDSVVLKNLIRSFRQEKIASGLLPVPGAGHTPQVEPLARELIGSLRGLQPQIASIPMVSTATGTAVVGTECDAEYWGRHLMEPILFADAMDSLLENGHDVFLEISAEPTLSSSIRHCLKHRGKKGTILASLRPGKEDAETLRESLNQLYKLGVAPVAKPITITESYENEFKMASHGGSVIHLERYIAKDILNSPEVNRNSDGERRSGQDRRKLKLPSNVIELKLGKERRTGQERRNVQERRIAVG